MSASDAPGGSRVTITSDGALNDYSAYRSGDRFYVVIPQANAKGVGGVRGRGFEGAQVQRRGQDVVLSFKLQPGASAHVDQKFNRLVVQFNAPEIGTQTQNANRATQQPTPEARTPVENAGTPTPTPAVRPTPQAQPTPATGTLPPGVVPSPLVVPSGVGQATPALAVPSPTVSPATTPAPTPEQIAQLGPTPSAPVGTTIAPAPVAAPVSLGTTILRNWPFVIIALIVLAALGLFVFARSTERGEQRPPAFEPPASKETPKAELPAREPVPTQTAAPSQTAAPDIVSPVVASAVIAPAVRPVETRKQKGKKGKKGKHRRESTPTVAAPPVAQAVEPPIVHETAPPAVGETAPPVTTETQPTIEAGTLAAAGALAVGGALAAAEVSAPAVEEAESAGLAERAGAETRKLLAGDDYDEAFLSSTDAATRRLVASELMTALATESDATRSERARAAFLKHGYFDDAARELRTAEEPTQRASAARTLGLVGDRTATEQLVAALEDPAPEVRRASVEALTELQDPRARGPLEALRWRETSRLLPRQLIQQALEACTVAAVVAPVVELPAAPPAESETAAEPVAADEEVTQEVAVTAPTQAVETAETTEEIEAPEAAEEIGETTLERAPVIAPVAPDETLEAEAAYAPEVEAPPEVEVPPTPAEALGSEPEFERADEAERDAAADVVAASELPQAVAPASEPPVVAEAEAHVETEAEAAPAPEVEAPVVPQATAAFETPEAFTGSYPAAPALSEPVEELHETAAPAQEKGITEFEIAPHADEWIDVDVAEHRPADEPHAAQTPEPLDLFAEEVEAHAPAAWTATPETHAIEPTDAPAPPALERDEAVAEAAPLAVEANTAAAANAREIALPGEDDLSIIPKAIQLRLESDDASERAASVLALARLNTDEAFKQICTAFDDSAQEVREAAARALYTLADDRADSFTRALREAAPERRRRIGAAISSSGLADEAVSNLTGESRDKTYDAFSLLFLMAKAGETAPLIHAIEAHPDNEVRLAVVKLLALSGQHEILPSFRRLAVRGSLPTEVRSAVMEAIYQISSQPQHTT